MRKLVVFSILIIFNPFFFSIGYSQQVEGLQQESTIFQGTTVIEQVYSPGLDGNLLGDPATQQVKIYLPPGYEDYPDNSYPAIYLLHGHSQNYNSFYVYGLLNMLNRKISNKIIDPMIVVTPHGNNKYTGCMYTNSYVSGNWEDYIVQDVTNFVEDNYRILDQRQSRGLGGFSSGGYGTIKIGMKHPSIYGSICIIGSSITSFNERFLEGSGKESMIEAAGLEIYHSGLSGSVKRRFSNAVAFAPDSTAKPVMGRFPFTGEGEFVDSTWQKWLMHDPFTMLQTYRDSLLELRAIQMYVGKNDFLLPQNEIFHQALVDHGIDHGYKTYSGGHDPVPVLGSLLNFFSENLVGVVPTINLLSDYYLKKTETLIVETNMDGNIYVVPLSTNTIIDSILKYQVITITAIAEQEIAIPLADIKIGKYRCFAVSNIGGLSMLTGEFYLIPDAPLELNMAGDTPGQDSTAVDRGDTIWATISRDGTIYLVSRDTPGRVDEISDPLNKVDSTLAFEDAVAGISTSGLALGSYRIYGVDTYDVVSNPHTVYIQKGSNEIAPDIMLDSDTVNMGDPITTMLNKDGTIYLVWPDTPNLISLIRDPENLIDSTEATGNVAVELSTVGLEAGVYWIYTANPFEIVSSYYNVWIQDTVTISSAQSIMSAVFTIFPNPVDEIITITSSGPVLHNIEITNLSGQLLYKNRIEGTSSKIDLSSFQKGVYLITIRSKDFVTIKKIIKL